MDDLPDILFGWLGSLLVALALVVGTAVALQAWHSVHHQRRPVPVIEAMPAPSLTAPSTYWSGRR